MSDSVATATSLSLPTMTFNFSSPYLSSNAILRQELFLDEPEDDEDDDLDAYYMDMPPIDITERLREVNKALMDDPTPVNMKREIKLRFKDNIAEFQSPRESESDDGYGDSSEIMYDVEEDTDSLCGVSKPLTEEILDSVTVLQIGDAYTDIKKQPEPEEKVADTHKSIADVPITKEELDLIDSPVENNAERTDQYEDDFEDDIEEAVSADNSTQDEIKIRVIPLPKNRTHNDPKTTNDVQVSEYSTKAPPDYNPINQLPVESFSKTKSKKNSSVKVENDLSVPKPKTKGLPCSQPIPIKPNLLSPYHLTTKSNSFSSTTRTKLKFRRATSPNHIALTKPSDVKSKPFVPTRVPPKPMKAIHHESMYASQIANENSKSHPVFHRKKNRVRKAASTTDLHRRENDPQREMNDTVYKAWLQQKKQEATATKKEEKHLRSTKQAECAVKFAERKRLAEEAFQQWLKKKKEQLQLEKKIRSHQRKLEHQTSYAKSRLQCDEAYKEWCSRKKDEVTMRRATGASSRSRSLERTWAQDKTRKLYSAYLTRN